MKIFSRASSRSKQTSELVDELNQTDPSSEGANQAARDSDASLVASESKTEEIFAGTDVLKELTDQFALIDGKNASDLHTVGAALIQIPSQLPAVSNNFVSFRHEVLHSILSAAMKSGDLVTRCDVLLKCFDTNDLTAEELENVSKLKSAVADIIDDLLGRDAEYSILIRSQLENIAIGDEETSIHSAIGTEIFDADSRAIEDTEQELSPGAFVLTDGGVGSKQHAEILLENNRQARERVLAEKGTIEESVVISRDVHTKAFSEILNQANENFLKTLANLFDREEKNIEDYGQICDDILGINDRILESRRCIEYIEAGVRGDTPDATTLGPNNEWLILLVEQLGEINSAQTSLSLEKGESIKTQLSDIQAEVDALQDAIKSTGANTLEPPNPIIQSLMGEDDSSNSVPPIDYEESIDRYIDWMTSQRSQIRDYKDKLELLEQEMLDIERLADENYKTDLELLSAKKLEVSKSLGEALKSAHKDADQSERVRVALESDAVLMLSKVEDCVISRKRFMASAEEVMAGTMITMGRTIDELERISGESLVSET